MFFALAKKIAVNKYIDLTVKVSEENPETSYSEWGGLLRPIKNVQGKGYSEQNWMVVERRSELLRFLQTS